jgi:hypothetical protein
VLFHVKLRQFLCESVGFELREQGLQIFHVESAAVA